MKKHFKYMALANRYARAIFELSQENHTVSTTFDELGRFLSATQIFPALLITLKNTKLQTEKRRNIIVEISKNLTLSPLVINTISLLMMRNRLDLFESIVESFGEIKERWEKLIHIEAQIADHAYVDLFREKTEKTLLEVLKKKIICNVFVNPEIIGGTIIKIGDTALDMSIAGKLKTMKEELLKGL